MIVATLAELDAWYNEVSGVDRPRLLSKLALLELCGWLETEQDRILLAIDASCLKDAAWTNTEVLRHVNGFGYNRHFRPMLARIVGEHLVRKLEFEIEGKYPGDVDRLKTISGDLWAKRCSFAHEDLTVNVAKQQRFDAPSWSITQYRTISGVLGRFEAEAITLATSL